MPRKRQPIKNIYVIVGHAGKGVVRDVTIRLARGAQQAELLGTQARQAHTMVAYAHRADRVGRLVSEWLRGCSDHFT